MTTLDLPRPPVRTTPRQRPPLPVQDALDVVQTREVERFAAACRTQERALALPAASRETGLSLRMRREVLAREREALVETTHRQLLSSGAGCNRAARRAVVAHHLPWFVTALTEALEERGVQVVGATGNGATAVGMAVAEQPDLVVVHCVLEMLSGDEVAATVREHVPGARVITLPQSLSPTVVAVQALRILVGQAVPA